MKTFFTLLLVILFSSLYSQNYISYYNLCNAADRAVYEKEYDSAMLLYEKAFELVPYVHNDYLTKAISCASKVKKPELAYRFVKQYYLQSGYVSVFDERVVKRQIKNPTFSILKDSLLNLVVSPYNAVYQKAIDSIIFIDQTVLRNNFKDTAGYNLKTPEDWENLEARNFQKLLNYIELYGYPSERLVGKKSYDDAYIVLLHNIRLEKNRSYLSIVKKALMEGDCLPDDYGWIIDQACSNDSTPYVFYLYEANPGKLSQSRKKEINQERCKYGIKPIEAYGALRIFNLLMTYKKW